MTPCSAQKFMPMEFVTYGGVGKTKAIQSQVCIGCCIMLVAPKADMLQAIQLMVESNFDLMVSIEAKSLILLLVGDACIFFFIDVTKLIVLKS